MDPALEIHAGSVVEASLNLSRELSFLLVQYERIVHTKYVWFSVSYLSAFERLLAFEIGKHLVVQSVVLHDSVGVYRPI